jgi:hypothetical protein
MQMFKKIKSVASGMLVIYLTISSKSNIEGFLHLWNFFLSQIYLLSLVSSFDINTSIDASHLQYAVYNIMYNEWTEDTFWYQYIFW